MRLRHLSLIVLVSLFVVAEVHDRDNGFITAARLEAQPSSAAPLVPLPNREGSLKFGALGDFGNGTRPQYELAEQMVKLHERFKYDMVVLLGDNLLGSERPQDFKIKFEVPYKPLLDAGVKFYASLGNHDAREQRFYKLFNMGGHLYYTVNPRPDVCFFMLETTYPTPEQFEWLEKELKASTSDWKIAVFHHPLYSSGNSHGSDLRLREMLEPFLVKYNVSVALSGHDHVYERLKPQKGITYFVVGSGGELRAGDIKRGSAMTAKGFDTDRAFMAAEIIGDEMYFNAISRTGQTVDSGVLTRRKITP
jgi:3',5'-cyclic AMP phosphodiesterase CpdA